MTGNVVVIVADQPYMSRKAIAEKLDISVRTVADLVKGLQEGIKDGRYDPMVVADHRYNFYAILDQMKYREALKEKNLKKNVPPFNPGKIAELCGYGMQIVRVG